MMMSMVGFWRRVVVGGMTCMRRYPHGPASLERLTQAPRHGHSDVGSLVYKEIIMHKLFIKLYRISVQKLKQGVIKTILLF